MIKKDDTLALAVSMVNGLWLTMGTDEVGAAVRNDTGGLLAFLRETNAIHESRGYFRLEDLPLEAKIASRVACTSRAQRLESNDSQR